MNRKDAESEKRTFLPDWHCPLQGTKCHSRCIFYQQSCVVNMYADYANCTADYEVIEGYCLLAKCAEQYLK